MSEYGNAQRSSSNPKRKYSSRPRPTDDAKGSSKKSSFGRPLVPASGPKKGAGPGAPHSRPRPAGRTKKAVKTFDPSTFINNAEEQVAAPTYQTQHAFADFAIDERIKNNIAARGYRTPTPVQDQAIPLILAGKDILACANTGTGKTAAFLIPLVHNVLATTTSRVLIIAPTRELADQINEELRIFKQGTGIISALCIGGVNIANQIDHLKKHPQFVIGTPGRLKDLEQQRVINFSAFTTIVLDEVDTMLDMGFIHDMQYIINKLPHSRHSLFFSATLPAALKKIVASFLRQPASINVKTRQSAENVNQSVIKVNQAHKVDVLHDLLIKPEFTKTIIFLRTKWCADKLAKALRVRGFTVAAIHGDKTQAQRKKALASFKDGSVTILLATDVVARGIDVDEVSHVINYDMPQTHEDYIHRIGRTGRADKVGNAITFIE